MSSKSRKFTQNQLAGALICPTTNDDDDDDTIRRKAFPLFPNFCLFFVCFSCLVFLLL